MLLGFDAFAQTPYAALGYVEGVVSEAITVTEVQNSQFAFVGNVAETMTLVDAQTGNATYPVVVVENLVVTNTQNVTAQFSSSIAEALTLSAAQSTTAIFVGNVAETMTVTDLQAGSVVYFVLVNESLTLTNSQNVLVAFVGNVAERISMLESSTARADYVDSVLEFLSVTDSQCPFGWFKISNTQIPEWGIVNINVNELAAYGAFTFGGVPFAGSLNVSGQAANPIPDAQTPNWTHIDEDVGTSWTEVNSNQNC